MLGLLLAVAPFAWAKSDCQLAFEKWAILSRARVRIVPQSESGSANGRGACVLTEAVRRELLDGLARARSLCAQSSFLPDKGVQQTRTLLNINESFIDSLVVCPPESAGSEADWVTRSAPAAKKPAVTAAPPPKPVVASPPPKPPKPIVRASPPAPPKPVVGGPLPIPPCLEISPAGEGRYALTNRRCRGHTVLAVIETRGAAGETVCRGYAISQGLSVRTFKDAPPRINYECVLSRARCNKGRLGNMFPECDWP